MSGPTRFLSVAGSTLTRAALSALLTAAALCMVAAGGAAAQTSEPWGCMIVPASGAKGVELDVLTVDVTLRDGDDAAGETAFAVSNVWLRLRNPASAAVTLPIRLVSVAEDGGAAVQMLVNDVPYTLTQTLAPSAGGSAVSSSAEPIRIPGGGRTTVRLTCTQELGGDGIVRSLTFPATAASSWSGTPESVRVTVQHADPHARDRIVSTLPDKGQAINLPLEWQWSAQRVVQDIRVELYDAIWWSVYVDARDAASRADATAADHLLLARLLQELDVALTGRDNAGGTLRSATIVAEYHAAAETANDDAERAAAHRALAHLYLERAEANQAAPDWQAALDELRAAQELGDLAEGDGELEAELIASLQTAARLAGQDDVASRYATQSAERGLSAPLDDPAVLLSAALAAAEGGDHAAARSILEQAFGPGAGVLKDAPPPTLTLTEVAVRMLPGARQTDILLSGAGAEALRAELMAALAGLPGTTAELLPEGLTLRLEYTTPGDLAGTMEEIVARIPDRPELALVRAAFAPASLTWEKSGGLFRTVTIYSELVDLGPALGAWEDLAFRLETDPGQLPADFSLGDDAAGVLRRVQRTLWSRDAEEWRALGRVSGAEYTIAPMGQDEVRAIRVKAGEARLMVSQDDSLPTQRYRLLALFAVPLLLTAVVLVRRNG